MGGAPVAPCKLCGTTATLQWSHIMPKWTYKRVIRTSGGDPNPVTVRDGVARRGGKQLAEYMLCRACEERIGPWESYVASIAVQEDDSFPARDVLDIDHSMVGDEMIVADASALDIAKIVRFAASVVWRASVSAEFPKVDLGPAWNQAIAAFMLGAETAALPASVYVISETITPPPGVDIDEFCLGPYGGPVDGRAIVYRFALWGFVFHLAIGDDTSEGLREACIGRTRRMLMTDGAMLLPHIAEMYDDVNAKGGPTWTRKKK